MYVMVLILLVFGSIPKIGALATIVPVSYTHLDVYKRQNLA